MPNGTDFTAIRALPITGLGFAFIDGWERYHTARDSIDRLDPRSLQHHGDAALALARRFGTTDLARLPSPDLVFFSIAGTGLVVRYPSGWALPFAALIALAFLVVLAGALRRRDARLGGFLVATLVVLAFLAAAAFGGRTYPRLPTFLHQAWLPAGDALRSVWYAAALGAVVVAAWLAIYALLRRRLSPTTLALAAAFLLSAAAVASAWFVPGASYLLAWPAAACVAGAALSARHFRRPGVPVALALGVIALPALALIWPLLPTVFTALGLTAPGTAAVAALAAIGAVSLSPQSEIVTDGGRWWPAGVALLVAATLFAVGAATTRYSPSHPRQVNVLYLVDADQQVATWAVRNRPDSLSPWLAQFLGEAPRAAAPPQLAPPGTHRLRAGRVAQLRGAGIAVPGAHRHRGRRGGTGEGTRGHGAGRSGGRGTSRGAPARRPGDPGRARGRRGRLRPEDRHARHLELRLQQRAGRGLPRDAPTPGGGPVAARRPRPISRPSADPRPHRPAPPARHRSPRRRRRDDREEELRVLSRGSGDPAVRPSGGPAIQRVRLPNSRLITHNS